MNRREFFSASAALGGAALTSSTPAIGSKSAVRPSLSTADIQEITNVPGVALVGQVDGQAVRQYSGLRSADDGQLITEETIFPAASLSKVVFAWAVTALVHEGKLDWKAPIARYGDFGLEGAAQRVTVEQAMSHSSGLPNWRFKEEPLNVSFEPGTRFSYSGEGIFLVQAVVETIVGEPVAKYMQRLLPSLGITRGSFAWRPGFLANAAIGHDGQGKRMEKSLAFYEKSNFEILQAAGLEPETATLEQIRKAYKRADRSPLPILLSPNMAGSLWLHPAEYAVFLGRVMSAVRDNGEEFRPRVQINKKMSYAIAWGIDHTLPEVSLFSYGDGPGTKHFAWIQPQRKTAVAIFTNGDRGAHLYTGLLRNQLQQDPATLYWV